MQKSINDTVVTVRGIDRVTGSESWESTIGGLSSWGLSDKDITQIMAGQTVKAYSPNGRRVIDITKKVEEKKYSTGGQLTETDLNNLINEHLDKCEGYEEVCKLTATPTGRERVRNRVKEIITKDGITSIAACLAQIESELRMDV